MDRRKKVLLLCNYYPGTAGAIMDHIHAFTKYSRNEYFTLSNMGDLPDWLDLSRFDALVFHYSLVACYDSYISPAGRKRIREFNGFKAAFVQDDYRWINDTVNAFAYMKIHALFPLTAPAIMDQVYSPDRLPGVRKETVLAGYVPEDLLNFPVKPFAERPVDVAYRARKLPAWMGSHTLQKWQIAERFLQDAKRLDLNVDISCREEDRIYGDEWTSFIANSKATLGTESGASICDFSGDIQRNVEAHLAKYPDDDFATLNKLYLGDEDNRIIMNVISPRCFEAAALRTLMILYEGDYSGVLVPWRHYVPLQRDHSNMEEVAALLRDPARAQKIIDCAYEEIARNEKYSYASMVKLVDSVMEEEWKPGLVGAICSYSQDEFDWNKSHRPAIGSRVDGLTAEHWLFYNVHTDTCEPGTAEVSLDTIRYLKAIALSWNDMAKGRNDYRIELLMDDLVKSTHTISCLEGADFSITELPIDRPGANRIRITGNFGVNSVCPSPVTVYIAGSRSPRPRRKQLQEKAETILKPVWHSMPEGVKTVLRPAVAFNQRLLKRLLA